MNAKQNYKWNELTMGTCYYPEHWDKKLWADDLDRMKKAGISVIRIAEFAWSKVEPEEGVFTYDFFDEFLDLCSEKQMKVIFGTPTATPPAWLTEKYPEVPPEVFEPVPDSVLLYNGGSSSLGSRCCPTEAADADGGRSSWKMPSLRSAHPTDPSDGRS